MAEIGDLSVTITLDTTQYLAGLDDVLSASQDTAQAITESWTEISTPVLDPEEWNAGLDEMASATQEVADQITENWTSISNPTLNSEEFTGGLEEITATASDSAGQITASWERISTPTLNPEEFTAGVGEMATTADTSFAEIESAYATMVAAMQAQTLEMVTTLQGEYTSMVALAVSAFADNLGPQISKAVTQALTDAQAQFKKFGSSATQFGTGILIPAGIAAGAGLYEASNRSDILQGFQGNTGATDQQTQLVGQEAEQLTAQTGQSFQSIVGAFQHIYSLFTGISDSDALKYVTESTKFAANDNSQADVTTNTLAQLAKQFNVTGDNLFPFMNQVAKTVQEANLNLTQFNGAIGQAAEQAGTMNLSFTDFASAFDTLTKAGNSPDEAGTKLKDIIQNIANPKNLNAIADLSKVSGIDLNSDFTTQGLQKKGITGVIEDIQKATSPEMIAKYAAAAPNSISPDMAKVFFTAGRDQLGALGELFPDTRSALGVQALIQPKNQSETGQIASDIGNATKTGAIDKQFADNQKKVGQEMKDLQQNVLNLASDLGTVLIPQIDDLVKKITPVVHGMDDWIKKHPSLVSNTLTVALAVGGLSVGVGALSKWIGGLIGVFKFLFPIITGFVIPALDGLGGILLGLVGITGAPIAVTVALGAAFVTAGILLITHWQQVWNFLKEFWGWLGSAFSGVANFFVSLWSAEINGIGRGIDSLWSFITGKVSGLIKGATNWGSDLIHNFVSGIQSAYQWMENAVKGIGDMISSFLHFSKPDKGPLASVDTWMPDMMDTLVKGINQNAPKLKSAINNALSGAGNSLLSASVPVGGTGGSVQNSRVVNQTNTINLNGGQNNWQQQQAMKSIFSPANLSKLAYY